MDNAFNEAPEALNSANLRRYTNVQCPKARRRRLKAVERLVRVLLGDPNIVCGTNTKGELCLSGGACTALSGPLGGHLAFTLQEHEALSMLRLACSMHLFHRALLRISPLHTTGPKDRSATGHALLSASNHCKVYHTPQQGSCPCAFAVNCAKCNIFGPGYWESPPWWRCHCCHFS